MNAGVKSRQFCSVCKQWLEMEVVPTSDGDDDDGVIWYRCPQCQGFLPKLKNGSNTEEPEVKPSGSVDESAAPDAAPDDTTDDVLGYDSPSDMMAAEKAEAGAEEPGMGILPEGDEPDELVEPEGKADSKADPKTPEKTEPIQEYAAMLAEVDPSAAVPYRPWAEYEVGQCVHHLAWDDCGVVVGLETLPGNRNIIKVYFETAGVVRLIEKAPR